jgi:hypothetical protein
MDDNLPRKENETPPEYLEHGQIHPVDTPVHPSTPQEEPKEESKKEATHNSPLIHVTHDDKVRAQDPPMIDLKVTNPVTYLKNWFAKILGNEGIDISIKIKPLTIVAFVIAFTTIGGLGFSIGRFFFPNSSPLLHREVKYQGLLQKSGSSYNLLLADATIYKLSPLGKGLNLDKGAGKQVLVKGNLTKEANVIEVSEPIVVLEDTAPAPAPVKEATSLSSDLVSSEPFILYSGISWETTEAKTLVFSSGKRKINITGQHIESIDLKVFPQDFIDFYVKSLKTSGWTQVLYTITADETIYSFKKDESYITIGVKNLYSGKLGDKITAGYKAYIEHN